MRIDDENLRKSRSPFREYRRASFILCPCFDRGGREGGEREGREKEKEREKGEKKKKKNRSRIDFHYDSRNRNCRNCVAVLRS